MTGYVMIAIDVDGEEFAQRVSPARPTSAEAAAFGELHEANFVVANRGEAWTVFGRESGGNWAIVTADVGLEAAKDLLLWFELLHHFHGQQDHPLTAAPRLGPDAWHVDEARAIALVVARIRARAMGYPTEALEAARFDAGWRVYAPAEVDESSPTAFLASLPVDRSAFLVSDLGRIKEVTSSRPPGQTNAMFVAEEAFARGGTAEEEFMTELAEAFKQSASDDASVYSDFRIGTSPARELARQAAGLTDAIAQQTALLGPAGWDGFTAIFSCTVSAELAEVRFRYGDRSREVPVPEQISVLARRQRHLASRMPDGPWLRMTLTLSRQGASAQVTSEYDYGDKRLPDRYLLTPEDYRNDLAAYPRPAVPAWLAVYVAEQDTAAAPPPPSEPEMVLDTKVALHRLHADAHQIVNGRRSIALEDVEWVSYTATHITTKSHFGLVKTQDHKWHFSVGPFPYSHITMLDVELTTHGADTTPPEAWQFLVKLSRRQIEPRLVAEFAARIRGGESVNVGNLPMHPDGVGPREQLLTWSSLQRIQAAGGRLCIYPEGQERPQFSIPLKNPNALLIPDVIAAITDPRRR
jgi:hypothetical protein